MTLSNGTTFEQQLSLLEQTVQRLEQEELALDEMLALYAEGVELARSCQAKLSAAAAALAPEAAPAAGRERQG